MTGPISKSKLYSILSACAVGLMVLFAAFDLLMPKPKPTKTTAAWNKQIAEASTQITQNTEALGDSQKKVASLIWKEPAAKIVPATLEMVSTLAQRHQLKLDAVRPQRTATDQGLLRLPFTISLEGSYTNVISFLSDLETTSRKLAVNLVQVASSEASNDQVAASIGVLAYAPLTDTASTPATSAKTKKATVTPPTVSVPPKLGISGRPAQKSNTVGTEELTNTKNSAPGARGSTGGKP